MCPLNIFKYLLHLHINLPSKNIHETVKDINLTVNEEYTSTGFIFLCNFSQKYSVKLWYEMIN